MRVSNKLIKKKQIFRSRSHQSVLSHIYLDRASVPMSTALPDALAQKALTAALSLAVRLILPVDCLFEADPWGVFIHKTGHGHTRTTSKIGCVAFGRDPTGMLQLA